MSRRQDRVRRDALAGVLVLIESHDLDYAVRNVLVLQAMAEAALLGYRTGVRLDPATPGWPVVFLELPTGQVSWHLPQHPIAWDGHDTATKYARLVAYVDLVRGESSTGPPAPAPPAPVEAA